MGSTTQKSVGQRHLKSQGTSKLNTYCTASIKTIADKSTCEIQTEACSTHYGHSLDLWHIQLSENVRLMLAGQLLQGDSFILDNIDIT